MKNSASRLNRIAVLLLILLLVVAASVLVHLFLPTANWEAIPFHSTVEALGALAALAMAAFLLMMRKGRNDLAHYVWISAALIGMGLLDGFHASVLPGYGFVWLHSTATVVGGVLFALVWLPDRFARSRWTGALPWVVAIAAAIFGALSVAFRPVFPLMVVAGEFTADAKIINLLGGLLFLAAAARFSLRYWANESGDDLLFASLCLLFGAAGVLFSLSKPWQADWWLWHFIRLAAYFIALGYVFVIFQRAEAELAAAKNELEAKVFELGHANRTLQAEIAERKRAEETVTRQSREILEISTPIIQVWKGILTAPLIGALDSQRAQRLVEALLQRIVETQARVVILDITAVPLVDTAVANHLIKTVRAANLLGARCLLVGIRPEIAQTVVHLGMDLSGIETCADLQSGLERAVGMVGTRLPKSDRLRKSTKEAK